jgi:hypothetical protein
MKIKTSDIRIHFEDVYLKLESSSCFCSSVILDVTLSLKLKCDVCIMQGYNIHINGVFHCTVRYRQLHNLHEQLKKEYGANNLPVFPPKKLLPLSSTQLEERRAMLEKYIQSGNMFVWYS